MKIPVSGPRASVVAITQFIIALPTRVQLVSEGPRKTKEVGRRRRKQALTVAVAGDVSRLGFSGNRAVGEHPLASSFHGMMAAPMTAVSTPPVGRWERGVQCSESGWGLRGAL
jgi:hypothetical protein